VSKRRIVREAAFQLYAAAYIAVLGVDVLDDVSRASVRSAELGRPLPVLIAIGAVSLIVLAGVAGRVGVALRPSAAEVQFSLLSSTLRERSLARAVRSALGLSVTAAVALGVVVMVLCPAQFGAVGIGGRMAYLAFAGGVGALALAVHLLVAERRVTPLAIAGLAVATTFVADIANGIHRSLTSVLVPTLGLGAVGLWHASRNAERIPLERVARGSFALDSAALAVAGNDVRSLMLALRNFGESPWRSRSRFEVPTALAVRFPVTARTVRSVARWRLSRWVGIAALVLGITGMCTSGERSLTRAALAALLLWALGLYLNEPLAQEHDRRDRLASLPNARSVEVRHVVVGWATTFGVLVPAFATRLPFAASVFLGVAGASAATVAAAMSLRSTWTLLLNPRHIGMPPELVAGHMLYKLARPALVALVCLGSWRAGVVGIGVALPGMCAVAVLLAWVATNNFERARTSFAGLVFR